MIGGKVGPLLNELLQKGTPVVRGEDKMVVGNVVSTNYGRNSSLRWAYPYLISHNLQHAF